MAQKATDVQCPRLNIFLENIDMDAVCTDQRSALENTQHARWERYTTMSRSMPIVEAHHRQGVSGRVEASVF